jgi:antitoxin (DNA-binding transcriptional repressor) of toxin-antitoxin stability system
MLSRAERGEEILITKHNKPVAVLSPYRSPSMTAEREAAIRHALQMTKKGLPWGDALPRFVGILLTSSLRLPFSRAR